MAPTNSLVLLLTVCLASTSTAKPAGDPVIEGTELIFAFMTHRHGNRSPVPSTITLVGDSVDTTVAEELIAQYGYGQLTDAGKSTGYNCGKFIRRRYNDLIAPKFNKSELYIRSTDSTRVKMTCLAAMSAVFPTGEDNWSQEINWTPVTYTTLPVKYDYNEAIVNCPEFMTPYYSLMYSANDRMDPYAELIEKVVNITGYDISSSPVLISSVYDVYVSLQSLGYDLNDDVLALMDELKEAAGVAWDINYGDDSLLHYQAGPMLNEFFEYASQIIAGNDTQKVRIYAAHDANVYSFESITRIAPRQGAPKYASLYSLELRRVTETGQYVVLPVYLDDPNVGVESYLQVQGCSGEFLCDYNEFLDITSQYVRDEATWRTECGFTDSLDIDSSTLD